MIPISFCLYAHSFWLGFPEKWDGGRCWSKIQKFPEKIYKAHVSRKKQGMYVKDKDSTMISNQEVLAQCLSSLDCACRGWTRSASVCIVVNGDNEDLDFAESPNLITQEKALRKLS